MGKVKDAERIEPAVNYLLKMKCKKIILGCTEINLLINLSRTKYLLILTYY